MSYYTLIPSKNRLGCTLHLSMDALRAVTDSNQVMRDAVEQQYEKLIRKIISEHTTCTELALPKEGQLVYAFECYVFSKDEIQALIAEAREDGARDAIRFGAARHL